MSDFIDRAKLEAEADYYTSFMVGRSERIAHRAFLAGAAAYAALLDAETTEEWGVAFRMKAGNLFVDPTVDQDDATFRVREGDTYDTVVRRRVTSWLPSEGGEKP